MDKRILGVLLTIFVFGWLCGAVYSEAVNPQISEFGPDVENPLLISNQDQKSPHDWVSQDQIHVTNDRVVIQIENPEWAKFAPTRSMDPVIDEGAHAIQIVPESEDEIHVGDIISYESRYANGLVIHRVMRIGHDENGWYAITKGDNNQLHDPQKVRFKQVKKVLVAIIY